MDNEKKIKIMDRISDIIKHRSLINIPDAPTKYEYLVEMVKNRLVTIKPVDREKYVWPFYIEHPKCVQLVFPTPPYDPNLDNKMLGVLDKFVKETRDCINEILSKDPPKIVLDLRNNVGGFLYAFYDSLLPLLPVAENQNLIYGVDRFGKIYMTMSNQNGHMVLQFEHGAERRPLHPVKSRPKCEVEVWVNSRSASSSELITILFAQEGHKVFGMPTLGLTTGMVSIELPNAEFNFPKYIFMDKHKKIYQPHDSHITIGEQVAKIPNDTAQRLNENVLVNLPQKVLDSITSDTGIPVFNNILSEYFSNNYHAGIEYKKSPISYCFVKNQLYIHIPKKCKTPIRHVLEEFEDKVKLGYPVLIDIRNAMLGEDDEEFMSIFDGMFKPWKVKLIETTHNQEDGYDSSKSELSKTNLVDQYAYVANTKPYNFGIYKKHVGKYSAINAKFWTNKFSTSGSIPSCIFLLFIKNTFGLYDESTLGDYYDYAFYTYQVENIKVQVYADKFLDESK